MKVELVLSEYFIKPSCKDNLQLENGIRDKMMKVIDLPFVLSKDITIRISDLQKEYNFTDHELEKLELNNFFDVQKIIALPTHFEIWLDNDNSFKNEFWIGYQESDPLIRVEIDYTPNIGDTVYYHAEIDDPFYERLEAIKELELEGIVVSKWTNLKGKKIVWTVYCDKHIHEAYAK